MAKVIVRSLKSKSGKKTALKAKRVKAADGRSISIHTLNASAKSFGNTHHQVFIRNVSKARRDNKLLVGSADVAPRKH